MVLRAQQWIQRNLANGFSIAALADQLAVSEPTLTRRFNEVLAIPAIKFVQ